MKKIRVFINGFGRIGRASAKILSRYERVEIVGINDLCDKDSLSGLFRFDSVYGGFNKNILEKTRFFKEKDPKNLCIEDLEIDILLQCSGVFLNRKSNEIFLKKGVKRVIISAPCNDATPTFIMGINEKDYDSQTIISASSCSANAIAPLLKIIEKEFKIKSAHFSMIHSYTADQNLLDVKHPSKDLRRARSAALNILPLQSSASQAVETILPFLKTKTASVSIRVPLASCTFYDLSIFVNKSSNKNLIEILKKEKSRYIDISGEACVSSDFIKNPHSAIVDLNFTYTVEKNLIKIGAWQDNEYAYALRLCELSLLVAESL